MNKIIIPTGYMGSGSSAITDLVAEFEDCKNEFKSYEYVMLHCPNGLFDLEDKLLTGNNAIRSDEALRTFRTQMKKLYDKKFWWVGNYKNIISTDFMDKVNNYLNNITQLHYDGYWYTHEEVNFKMFTKLIARKPFKIILKNKHFKPILKYNDGMQISFIKPNEFYNFSKEFIYDVINTISRGSKNVVLDQFLLPFNLFRVDNYFNDDTRVIVVQRDPRDVFILNKYIWAQNNFGVPMPYEVNEFCKYYKGMRESEKPTNSKKVLRINFEDLIYKYDETVKKVMKHLDFSEQMHINKKSRFNPDLSIKNTQIFNSSHKYDEEMKVIEQELKEYLYDFPYVLENKIENTMEF